MKIRSDSLIEAWVSIAAIRCWFTGYSWIAAGVGWLQEEKGCGLLLRVQGSHLISDWWDE